MFYIEKLQGEHPVAEVAYNRLNSKILKTINLKTTREQNNNSNQFLLFSH